MGGINDLRNIIIFSEQSFFGIQGNLVAKFKLLNEIEYEFIFGTETAKEIVSIDVS